MNSILFPRRITAVTEAVPQAVIEFIRPSIELIDLQKGGAILRSSLSHKLSSSVLPLRPQD
jgi:hypothetical protein